MSFKRTILFFVIALFAAMNSVLMSACGKAPKPEDTVALMMKWAHVRIVR